MRGVVSSAMAAALQRHGVTDAFDLVVGTSSGALNGAAFLSGIAQAATDNYCDASVVRRYIAPRRLLIGRAAVDVAYTLDQVTEALDVDRHRRTAESPAPLHCVAIDVERAAPEVLSHLRTEEELRSALLATTRLPWLGGAPVEFRGRRWLDGGLADPIPIDAAIERGATHVLVLQTRPEGVPRTPAAGIVEKIVARRLRALNPALVSLARERFAIYEAVVERIAAASRLDGGGGTGPHVLGVRLAAGTEPVGQLERSSAALCAAADAAQRRIDALLA